ncbi:MAG TPA: Wzz/FepE/Etk N-terminal domain-containing protein [Ktedonobacteraceae bacterium]|nr:Wzz/FepE/Etk N-terminal domain-containing protein [Ktedonobacteraceae bacterium]
MTFEQYWTIMLKQWKIIVICFVVVGAGAFIGSKLMKPLYQSTALVQVIIRSSNNNQADYTSLMASDQLVQTEATLATSDPVLREVATRYPGLTTAQLAKEVSSTPKTNTQLFQIDVIDPSPIRAAQLANDIADTLIRQQLVLTKQNNAQAQVQIQNTIDQTSKQINSTTATLATLQAKGGNEGQIAILKAQLSGQQQLYSQWQNVLAQLELSQAQDNSPLQIAQPAQPVSSAVQPRILVNTAGGFLAGLLLGVLLAMLFEQLDTRVRSPEAISTLLGWPTLATVRLAKTGNREDVLNPDGRDTNAEAYRMLRTNIGFAGLDKPLHSLMVTSSQPRDGKSVVAANLAIFMARAGKSTLLIDADLRRPTQQDLFQLPANGMGLSNAVLALSSTSMNAPRTPANSPFHKPDFQPMDPTATSRLSLGPFVHTVGISNLWVMPTGPLPPNPPELLDSKVMQHFLSVIATCGVEVVIFDAPPILGLSDASILASKVDGAIAVIDMTRATRNKLKLLKATIAQTNVNVLGCVANKFRGSRNDSTYASYYYYQAEEENDNEKSGRNGLAPHTPGTPLTPAFPSPFEQGKRANSSAPRA